MVAARGEESTKRFYRQLIADVRGKRDGLASTSLVRGLIPDAQLEKCLTWINETPSDELQVTPWRPPIIAVAHRLLPDGLLELDKDLRAMTSVRGGRKLLRDLGDSTPTHDAWAQRHGELFELSIKARVLGSRLQADFDYRLPNGRDVDVRVDVAGRVFHLECTALSKSRFEDEHWMLLSKKKLKDPTAVHGYGIAPKKTVRRIIAKVFEKLAKGDDPSKHQQATNSPNVLLLAFPDLDLRPDHIEVRWALDQIFAQKLDEFLDQWAARYKARPERYQRFLANRSALKSASSRISGVVMFDRFAVARSRRNPHAQSVHAIDDDELAAIVSLFERMPLWCQQLMR